MAQEIAGHLLTASLKPDVWTIEGFVPGPRGEFPGRHLHLYRNRALSQDPVYLPNDVELHDLAKRDAGEIVVAMIKTEESFTYYGPFRDREAAKRWLLRHDLPTLCRTMAIETRFRNLH